MIVNASPLLDVGIKCSVTNGNALLG